jgi:hypothetical protein
MNEDEVIPEVNIETDDESHNALNNLRIAIQSPTLLDYSDNLEKDAMMEGIKVAVVDPEDLENEEIILEKERLMGIRSLAEAHHAHQLQILSAEQKARKKLEKQYSVQLKNYNLLKDTSAHNHQLQQVLVSKVFRKHEQVIKNTMRDKNAELQINLEKSTEDQLLYGGINRVYKVSWKGRPQIVEIHVDECRDIKDKLERGEYWMRINTKEKIGGKILDYNILSDEWKYLSDPYFHDGKHSNKIMKFRFTFKLLVPSKLDIIPSMVYSFQILDRNSVIISEGYFPIIDNLFEVAQGKFKLPLIRGSVRNSIEKFGGIEELYRHNIDEWLCNAYFQVTLLPQVIEGETDYSVEVHASKAVCKELENQTHKKDYEELISSDQYSEYKYSVAKSGVLATPKSKIHYISSELIREFGFKVYKHPEMYTTIVLMIGIIWLSRYVHYSGQWLYLKAESFPVTTFQAKLLTLEIRYPDQTNLRIEMFVLLIGTLFEFMWFAIFCLFAFLSLVFLGRFPAILFRFIMCWGIMMIFDPLITLIECGIWAGVYNYWELDPFRLYNYFQTAENNGVVGILLTTFIYAGLIGFCSFVFYNYFLLLHMNGCLLDIFTRLNAPETHFFIPHDGEVSKRYLEWVCYKAKNYRSLNGDSRKVTVISYDMLEEFNSYLSMSAMHVIIYTVGNDRSRSVYRQFLRLPDGAIIELALNQFSRRSAFSVRYSTGPASASRLSPTKFR